MASTDAELQQHAITDFKEWRELEKLSNRTIINMTGGISFGPKSHKEMQGLLKTSVGDGDVVLSASELRQKFPALSVSDSYVGIWT